MEIVLHEDMFINNKLAVSFGDRKEALFTVIDEEFAGLNNLARINRVTILVRQFDAQGNAAGASLATGVIGLGDGVVGIRTDRLELRGELLTHENMDKCIVELYE
jgi:hypothetical protein